MPQLSEEEQKQILQSSPKGTLVIMLIFGVLFTLAWLLIYFGLFLHRGPVS